MKTNEKTVKLGVVQNGEIFKIGRFEFIKFSDEDGKVIAVSKDCLFDSRFGNDNNLSTSDVLKRMNKEILPEIEDIVGAENVLEFETDLLSLDGSDKHGKITSKISLPTFDFYRHNVKVFDRYKPDEWWWLATPDSTTNHYNDRWIVCVSPSGCVINCSCSGDGRGVRPFLIFSSSIFVSCEE